MTEDELERIKVGSKEQMQQGIALLGAGEWRAALSHFDRAVMLRETTPWRKDGEAAWSLAAAWINRSDAMRHLGDPKLLPEVIRSLDRGIEAMNHVPLAEKDIHVERLILAWLNRATVCGDAGMTQQSLEDFFKAEALLRQWGTDATPERILLCTMLHINRARVLLTLERADDALLESKTGIAKIRLLEPGDALIAQTGVRARSVLCQALAQFVDDPEASGVEDWIAAATDAAEEALAIVKRTGLIDPCVPDLVRYGGRIYRACQPQFLTEFLREWLTAEGPLANDPGLREEMMGVVQLARAEAGIRLRAAPHDDALAQRELRILKALE